MPFWVIYRFSDLLYLLLYKIGGYRKSIVRKNLINAFPEKSEVERKKIEKLFYKHLFDILLESFKGLSMTKEEFLKRQKLITPNMPQDILDNGSSALILGGHNGNWEWGGMSASFYANTDVIVLYTPIQNKYIDKFIKKSRTIYQTYFKSSLLASRIFKEYKNKNATFVLIADQSPSNPNRAHWLKFLNQDTAFLRGPSSYAINYNIPILFIEIKRIKRGYYTMSVTTLTETPQDYSPKELTSLYAKKLEEIILEHPEQWLWSHKRWKHSRREEESTKINP